MRHKFLVLTVKKWLKLVYQRAEKPYFFVRYTPTTVRPTYPSTRLKWERQSVSHDAASKYNFENFLLSGRFLKNQQNGRLWVTPVCGR